LRQVLAFLFVLLMASSARAEHVQFRIAAIAPDGTVWARELRALDADIRQVTGGAASIKYYFGAIAGDELTALERVRKGQLDGLAGAMFCPRIAPSLWVTRLAGLFHSRDEARQILNRLRPIVDQELAKSGFVSFGMASFGGEIFFTRKPVRTFAELRKTRLWTWNLDEYGNQEWPAMGLDTVAMPIEEAERAYNDGKVDGFLSVPTAALAYQWSVRALHYTNLNPAFTPGCLVVTRKSFDLVSAEHQRAILAAAAKFTVRFDVVSGQQEDALMNGLFDHQGCKGVPVSESFANDFRAAADSARQSVGQKLITPELLRQVTGWLGEIRAQPKPTARRPAH
jgi:TRAP-type transport system periplasmic protein